MDATMFPLLVVGLTSLAKETQYNDQIGLHHPKDKSTAAAINFQVYQSE